MKKGFCFAYSPRDRFIINSQDQKSVACANLGIIETLLGNLEDAIDIGASGESHSKCISHLHSFALSREFLDGIYLIQGDYDTVRERAKYTLELSQYNRFPNWVDISKIHLGSALINLGEVKQGFDSVKQGLSEFGSIGFQAYRPMVFCWLVNALLKSKMASEALPLLDKTLMDIEVSKEAWYLPEIYRMQGLERIQTGEAAKAETSFY